MVVVFEGYKGFVWCVDVGELCFGWGKCSLLIFCVYEVEYWNGKVEVQCWKVDFVKFVEQLVVGKLKFS